MEEVCEIVSSRKGHDKLSVRGYFMVKDKRCRNNYYWCCENRKSIYCNGRAVTRLSDGQHVLAKFVEHNHLPNTSGPAVSKAVGKHLANVNGIPRKSRIRFFSLDGTSTNHLQLVSSSLAETRKVSSASVVASLPCMNNIDPIPSFRINPALDAVKKVKIEEEYPSVCQSLQANDGVCSSVGSVKLELSGKTLYANNYRMENGGKNGALSKVDSNTSGRLLERVVSRLRTLRSERMSDVSVASEVYFNMPKASLDKSTQTEYACPVCSGLGRGLEQTSQNVSLK